MEGLVNVTLEGLEVAQGFMAVCGDVDNAFNVQVAKRELRM